MASNEIVEILRKIHDGTQGVKQPEVRKRKSEVWDCFDIIFQKSDNLAVGFVKCKLCDTVLKYNSHGGTSTMIRHRSVHITDEVRF